MEALTNALIHESAKPKSGIGIKICPRSPKIPCLLFADDCLLFCKLTHQTTLRLKHILDHFCMASGQSINFHKSILTFSKNASATHKQATMGMFNIPHSRSLGKYLGCPVFQGHPRHVTFNELIQRTSTRLDRWTGRFLSKAGRLVLIQSHLESLPAHTMQCFSLPQSVNLQLNRIHRNFLWNSSSASPGLPLIAWESICTPKSKGGLGLRRVEAINAAFQCKLAWRILTQDSSLWVQCLRTKYLAHCEFFQYIKKGTDSPVWKSLLRHRHLLAQGIRWKLGNGHRISFWFDNWLDNCNLLEMLHVQAEDLSQPSVMVAEFITPQRQWNISKLCEVISDQAIIQKIRGIDIPSTDLEDTICWGLDKTGEFTTKSAIWLAHKSQPLKKPDWAHKWIWTVDTMPKIQIFLWQLFHNALPVRDTLFHRGLPLDPLCPLCLQEVESIEHLFVHCPLSQRVSQLATQHGWLPSTFRWDSIYDLRLQLQTFQSCTRRRSLMQQLSFLLWTIWKHRNNVVFRQGTFNPLACLISAKKMTAVWRIRSSMAMEDQPRGTTTKFPTIYNRYVRWQPPHPGRFKLNFDGSAVNSSAAGGFLLRDWRGTVLKAAATNYGHTSSLVAEARAVKDGILMALRTGHNPIDVEGDNLVVIQALNGSGHVPWQISNIIRDIQHLLHDGIQITFTHVFREANMAADWLSKFGHSINHTFISDICFSPCLSQIVADDVIGRTLVRRGV